MLFQLSGKIFSLIFLEMRKNEQVASRELDIMWQIFHEMQTKLSKEIRGKRLVKMQDIRSPSGFA